MEKIVYLLWSKPAHHSNDFRQQIVTDAMVKIQALNARNIRFNVVDNDVEAAEKLRITTQDNPLNGMLSFWLNSSTQAKAIQDVLMNHVARLAGYVVSESEPLINTDQTTNDNQRTPGMNQVVLLKQPQRLSRQEWLETWLNSHTPIAIETQSTFGYRQNIVVRPITADALPIDAIVEENFPTEAMTNRQAFYNAVGNETLFKQREHEMMESCARFIDFHDIECIPMSEYNFS